MTDKSIVGDLINFRGLVYAPLNENGVVFLFGKIADDLNMYIEEIKPGFPDCIGRRYIGKGWERVAIEFEYQSKNFVQHGHDPTDCDLIICWEHNWTECPIEVIELKSEIQGLDNYPISKPDSVNKEADIEKSLDDIFKRVRPIDPVPSWYERIFDGMAKIDDSIWAKIGNKYVGWYCPERPFSSVEIKKQSIRIDCFSRGEKIDGTRISNIRFSPRWSSFTVKSEADVDKAIRILSESYKLIKTALKAGEPTSFFSGGEQPGSTEEENSLSDNESEEEI